MHAAHCIISHGGLGHFTHRWPPNPCGPKRPVQLLCMFVSSALTGLPHCHRCFTPCARMASLA